MVLQAQDLSGALEVFRDMQDRNQRISKVAWCYMISSLNKVLKRKGWPYAEFAYQLWEELQLQDFGPNDCHDAQYFATGEEGFLDLPRFVLGVGVYNRRGNIDILMLNVSVLLEMVGGGGCVS
jgi:hypothetical protein